MKNKFAYFFTLLIFVNISFAQKAKVQAAWRALSDYESTLKDGKPDVAYLNKAKDAIDLALTNEDTKKQGKTYAYKARIMYYLHLNNFNTELQKTEATNPNKKEALEMTYGNVLTQDIDAAVEAINKIQTVDPKYFKIIQDGLIKGPAELSEEDAKFLTASIQIKAEIYNIASGKYKAKKYDEASDYFYKVGMLNLELNNIKDTASFYNACALAGRAKNTEKILAYNKKMIDLKIAAPYNFQSMYTANLSKKDTAAALEILKKGRTDFPGDMDLLNTETNMYLATGKQQEALANLTASIEKDSTNGLFYYFRGSIYDNMANPKDAAGKDKEKPANFDELFKNAETNYLKVIQLNNNTKDFYYNSLFNLGAMYNNYGGYLQNKAGNLPLTELKTKGKDLEVKAQENYKKAIPHLEHALSLKPDDKTTMAALRGLYLHTGDNAKAAEMNTKIKAK